MNVRIHPTAIVESGVEIGPASTVWDSAHIRAPTTIGSQCVVGEKSYIAYGVAIGDRVKINAFVYICTALTIETGVMIAAGTVFTNDPFPRATTPDLLTLKGAGPGEHTLPTIVREGATIGARCVIGCGLEIGRFAMVGMGAVVTRDVPPFHLVAGHPARMIGLVCRCGYRLRDMMGLQAKPSGELDCGACGRLYRLDDERVSEFPEPLRGYDAVGQALR